MEQLEKSIIEKLHLPTSDNKKNQENCRYVDAHPRNRSKLSQWADRLATNERSLGRLIERETCLSFGRWRQQLIIALSQKAEGRLVQAITGHLGYASVNALITMFKKAQGKSPT
ncbi:AraC family transcriptional regulator [Undibacterium sp. FT79W]|uniref:helix-turn-helix domain-containing protein n=1 Tax=Undibacterium sp. FT79W TaxID=2762296 RepID=UPI001C9B0964|nr:AraC family transcriptional regulator [Undibacterium sp. FT79W]